MEMNSKLINMYRKQSKINKLNSTKKSLSSNFLPGKISKEHEKQSISSHLNEKKGLSTEMRCNPSSVSGEIVDSTTNEHRNNLNNSQKFPVSTDFLHPALCSKTYSDIPGNEHNIKKFDQLIPFMRDKAIPQLFKIPLSRGIIVNGSTGCGKSSLIEAVANEHNLILYRVHATQFMNALTGQSEKYIKKVFNFGMECTNDCLLLIEDIDILFKKGSGHSGESLEDRIVHQIASCMDELINDYNNNLVCVVITTCRVSAIDPILRRSGRFEHELHIGIPNISTREAILRVVVQKLPLSAQVDMAQIARITPGFTAADLCAVVRGAVIHAYHRFNSSLQSQNHNDTDDPGIISPTFHRNDSSTNIDNSIRNNYDHYDSLEIEQCDLMNASRCVKPASMKEGFTDVTGITWKDIGAMDDVREELKLQILGPVMHKELFEELGCNPSSGILLYGPPGCGKTLVAKALASEAGLNFISVRGPEIVSMYVGESERMLRDIFSQAQNSAPCVIFFDEIDSICVKRSASSSDNNSSARLVNQLLTEMDGLISRENVHILAATNRPDILDPAVLRPGRFDKMIYIGLPNDKERLAIIKTITKGGTRPKISISLMNEIVHYTNGFSGADIVAFIRECTLAALKSVINHSSPNHAKCITKQHIELAQLRVKSSVPYEDLIKYEKMKERYSM